MYYDKNVGSHNIYKGDIKLILGLIWTLIQKYQLRMGGKCNDNDNIIIASLYINNFTIHTCS